jgi:hypothetical protein
MTLPANQALMMNATLQSTVDDLARRLAVLEQYIKVSGDGGLMIRAANGGLHLISASAAVEISGLMGVSLSGDRGVGILSNGNINVSTFANVNVTVNNQIVMNKAPTIQS